MSSPHWLFFCVLTSPEPSLAPSRSRAVSPSRTRRLATFRVFLPCCLGVSLGKLTFTACPFPLPLLHLAAHHHLRIHDERKARESIVTDSDIISATTRCFSHGSQNVMAQPPLSANKKKVVQNRDVLGTGSVGKNHGTCESLSGIYALKRYCKYFTNPTSWSSYTTACDMARTTRTVNPR